MAVVNGKMVTATEQIDYRKGDPRVRIALLVLLLVGVGLFFYFQAQISQILLAIQLMLDSDPQRALQVISRLLLWLVLTSGLLSIAVGFYLCVVSSRTLRSGEYPPPQLPVAFKTKIKRGKQARAMARSCLVLGALLFTQPVFGLLLWYWIGAGAL